MKRSTAAFFSALTISALLSGCATAASEPKPTPIDFKACVVSPTPIVSAGSATEQALTALERAVLTRGIEFDELYITQTQSTGSYAAGMTKLIEGGCDFVMASGHRMAKAVHRAATEHPQTNFALVDASLTDENGLAVDLQNVIEINSDISTQAFLAGYRAAAETKTEIVAALSGDRLETSQNQIWAFKQGVELFNSTNGANVLLLGAFGQDQSSWASTSSWADPAKTARLATSFIDRGADVVFLNTGTSEVSGLAKMLENSEALIVSVDAVTRERQPEKAGLLPASTLAVITKQLEQPVFEAIESALDDAFVGGDALSAKAELLQEFAVSPSGDVQGALREILEALNNGTLMIKQNS
jgi:basic membrane protein A